MKRTALENLIRGITEHILMEYMSSLSSSDLKKLSNENPNLDTTTPPTDAMSSIEKAKMDREAEKKRHDDLAAKELELKTAKSETDFQRKKIDQVKRSTIPSLTKDIQTLKGASIGESK